MALTRNYLKSLSLTGEQVEGVISAHAQTVDGLKSQIERYRSDAAALPDIQKELDDARQELLLLHADPWEERFHAISAEFESFKQQISDRELIQAKESAYRELLREVGVNERRIDAVMRVSDMECVQWEDGRIVNEAQLREQIREEWADFIGKVVVRGAKTPTPPAAVERRVELGRLPMREYIAKRREKRL